MSLTALEIYLIKGSRIDIQGKDAQVSPLVATFNRNLEALGFTLSGELMSIMSATDDKKIADLYEWMVPVLKRMTGAHRRFKPMYPNFPKQVMEASDMELYLNAITHYWVAFMGDVLNVPHRWLPKYKKDDREPLPEEEVTLRVIKAGSESDFNKIFTRLVGSNSSLSESDKEIVRWFTEKSPQCDSRTSARIDPSEGKPDAAIRLLVCQGSANIPVTVSQNRHRCVASHRGIVSR